MALIVRFKPYLVRPLSHFSCNQVFARRAFNSAEKAAFFETFLFEHRVNG
ncbi:Unknown protein sequence [Pseudomonas syringae pv. maculicola]|nr:Unknown protein sequence [Pseudomonas syringae pv. maculicola]